VIGARAARPITIRRSVGHIVIPVALFAFVMTGTASAQVYVGQAGGPRRGSVEVAGGFVWTGGFDVDAQAAELTGSTQTSFTLFTIDARVRPANGAQARVAFYLTPTLALEAGVQYSRPVLTARLSSDAEDAEDVTADETLSRYVVDGSIVYHLRGLSFAGGRGMPFLAAGAGYLRELHEDDQLIETGAEYHAGTGLKFWIARGRRSIGLRGDIGVTVRDGGFDFEEKRRMLPTAGASLVYLF
jgi:hypothetical protein